MPGNIGRCTYSFNGYTESDAGYLMMQVLSLVHTDHPLLIQILLSIYAEMRDNQGGTLRQQTNCFEMNEANFNDKWVAEGM
ncbi:hypothetical protein SUGI_0288180 [Cryptomeria japonica]|nr:hypothetical protein SUGI_0288180 [Cryptomeria japonica]